MSVVTTRNTCTPSARPASSRLASRAQALPSVRGTLPRGTLSSVHHTIRGTYHMTSISSGDLDAQRRRRRSTTAIKEALRELSIQLSLLNHHVGAHLDLNHVDLDCLDLINRHGPLSPSALARRAGLHPATATRPTAAPSSSAPDATATPSCCACTRG